MEKKEFHVRITKFNKTIRIPCENYKNHDKLRISRENHENHEILKL